MMGRSPKEQFGRGARGAIPEGQFWRVKGPSHEGGHSRGDEGPGGAINGGESEGCGDEGCWCWGLRSEGGLGQGEEPSGAEGRVGGREDVEGTRVAPFPL